MIVWDGGNPPPPTEDVPPPAIAPGDPDYAALMQCEANQDGGDPHECPRRQPAARTQKSEFLKTGGTVVETCAVGAACVTPQ
jgi:hypothetical protein